MDPWINSLTQSPFVRSMSTVPSKAQSFVHGVRDNVPPFSLQKVVVKPWNTISKTTQEQSHKFRIPQYGTLNRAYLRIEMHNQVPDTGSSGFTQEADYPATIFAKEDSSLLSTDSDFDALKAKVRLPWIHNCQLRARARKNAVLGGGGVTRSLPAAVQDAASIKAAAPTTTSSSHGATYDNVPPENMNGNSSNGWNVVNILDEIRLTSNGKTIETLYGETIPSEVVKMPPGLQNFYVKGMIGYRAGTVAGGFSTLAEDNEAVAWDPSACHRDLYGRLSTKPNNATDATTGSLSWSFGSQKAILSNQHAVFYAPVALSSLKTLSKNYQTRFVEDLELEVKMKEIGRGFNEYANVLDSNKYHNVELILIYHNWHDNIENTIRNSNYKKGVPASVYSTNWVRAGSGVADTSGVLSIPLTSRNLVTEILLVAKQNRVKGWNFIPSLAQKSSYTMIHPTSALVYDLEFVGSGKVIWSGRNTQLHGPDTADYDLTDRRLVGDDAAYGGKNPSRKADYENSIAGLGGTHVRAVNELRGDGGNITQSGIEYGFGDNMASLRFGLQTTDEFYSGGIALQTISNPTIKITHTVDWDDAQRGMEFVVYVKHANMVRIDSDTGAITRTLDV